MLQRFEVIFETEYLNQSRIGDLYSSFIDKRLAQALGVFHLIHLMLLQIFIMLLKISSLKNGFKPMHLDVKGNFVRHK